VLVSSGAWVQIPLQSSNPRSNWGKPNGLFRSSAAEAWWAHNPQVPGSKPGSEIFASFWDHPGARSSTPSDTNVAMEALRDEHTCSIRVRLSTASYLREVVPRVATTRSNAELGVVAWTVANLIYFNLLELKGRG
jgi:hypothetical protein